MRLPTWRTGVHRAHDGESSRARKHTRAGASHAGTFAGEHLPLVTDLKRGTDPWFVLTGDTLFVGAVGRPDLPGRARENAARLYASLHEKLLTSAGRHRDLSRAFLRVGVRRGFEREADEHIAFERRWNPMLAIEREAFVDALVRRASQAREMERDPCVQSWHEAVPTV